MAPLSHGAPSLLGPPPSFFSPLFIPPTITFPSVFIPDPIFQGVYQPYFPFQIPSSSFVFDELLKSVVKLVSSTSQLVQSIIYPGNIQTFKPKPSTTRVHHARQRSIPKQRRSIPKQRRPPTFRQPRSQPQHRPDVRKKTTMEWRPKRAAPPSPSPAAAAAADEAATNPSGPDDFSPVSLLGPPPAHLRPLSVSPAVSPAFHVPNPSPPASSPTRPQHEVPGSTSLSAEAVPFIPSLRLSSLADQVMIDKVKFYEPKVMISKDDASRYSLDDSWNLVETRRRIIPQKYISKTLDDFGSSPPEEFSSFKDAKNSLTQAARRLGIPLPKKSRHNKKFRPFKVATRASSRTRSKNNLDTNFVWG